MVPAEVHDRSAASELWLDYVSDLGDGFNSTYTVASLLARPELELVESTPEDGGPAQSHTTMRGRVLVMGGDQVYPVPKGSEYENRLLGPYRAAMPGPPGQTDLFVIPGSHDWYDGLINFTNIFCRHRDLGALRTSQTRSYFALALPHRWWLWGIDLQFGDFIDEAQLRYFAELAAEAMEPGDRIILSMAKEVDSGPKSSEVSSDRNLAYLTHEVVEPAGARVEVFLKSGRHYYCRYEEEEGSRQLITAGGGGAFLHPTHQLPERSSPYGAVGEQNYRRAATYPSAGHLQEAAQAGVPAARLQPAAGGGAGHRPRDAGLPAPPPPARPVPVVGCHRPVAGGVGEPGCVPADPAAHREHRRHGAAGPRRQRRAPAGARRGAFAAPDRRPGLRVRGGVPGGRLDAATKGSCPWWSSSSWCGWWAGSGESSGSQGTSGPPTAWATTATRSTPRSTTSTSRTSSASTSTPTGGSPSTPSASTGSAATGSCARRLRPTRRGSRRRTATSSPVSSSRRSGSRAAATSRPRPAPRSWIGPRPTGHRPRSKHRLPTARAQQEATAPPPTASSAGAG